MTKLAKGQRLKVRDIAPEGALRVGLAAQGLPLDFACFGLNDAGKLFGQNYMTIFNQPRTPCGAVQAGSVVGNADGFSFQFEKLPALIERIVIAVSASGADVMAHISTGHLKILESKGERELARFEFTGTDFSAEQVLMLGEFYRKDSDWRFMAVGQRFNGGLDTLMRHFGGTVNETLQSSPSPSTKISLEKRVEREASQLVNLVKQAGVSLEKAGLASHHAKVCLCLDISGSMSGLYRKGLVQSFAECILALACKFDDDGEIDVFLFGKQVHKPVPMGLSNWRSYLPLVIAGHPLEGDTRYGLAMEAIRKYCFPMPAAAQDVAHTRLRSRCT